MQIDLQAQSRAHRLGQARAVLVVRLQTAGSVEERVAAAAAAKRQVADTSITGAAPLLFTTCAPAVNGSIWTCSHLYSAERERCC